MRQRVGTLVGKRSLLSYLPSLSLRRFDCGKFHGKGMRWRKRRASSWMFGTENLGNPRWNQKAWIRTFLPIPRVRSLHKRGGFRRFHPKDGKLLAWMTCALRANERISLPVQPRATDPCTRRAYDTSDGILSRSRDDKLIRTHPVTDAGARPWLVRGWNVHHVPFGGRDVQVRRIQRHLGIVPSFHALRFRPLARIRVHRPTRKFQDRLPRRLSILHSSRSVG